MYLAARYGQFTARFDQEIYKPGSDVQVVFQTGRTKIAPTDEFDIVIQNIFEHTYTEITGSGESYTSRTVQKRNVNYQQHLVLTGKELINGFCFKLPEKVGLHPINTDLNNIYQMHYWEILVDKRKSKLWGRFFIEVAAAPSVQPSVEPIAIG